MVKIGTWGVIPVKVGVLYVLFQGFFLLKYLSKKEKGERKQPKKKGTLKYHFGGGRFHMLPQPYKFSHGLFWIISFRFCLIFNKRYQVTPLIYNNCVDEVSRFFRGRKLLGDMKYLMRSVKQAVEEVGIWTVDNQDVKRVNPLYAMVSGRINSKRNKRFDPLSWSSVVRDFINIGVILLYN